MTLLTRFLKIDKNIIWPISNDIRKRSFNKDAVQDINADKLRQNLVVNVIAPMPLNQIVLPYMKSGSAIVYIGSTLSEKAVANTASYTIAKHAVVGMMRSTCQDLADSGIHSYCMGGRYNISANATTRRRCNSSRIACPVKPA